VRTHVQSASMVIVLGLVTLGGPAQAGTYTDWAPAANIENVGGNSSELNTPQLDGCPILAPDGLSLYMATNRPRFEGDTRTDLDIWVAHRTSTHAPFGDPVNLGAPINSTADDFCPTPVRGNGLFFVSRRSTTESCGLGDIYFTRNNPVHGWSEAVHLRCDPLGPNSSLDEQGPSYVEAGPFPALYFSRSSATVSGDIFMSALSDDDFGPAQPVAELNDSSANDIQPNVRKDGRELVFSSNRAGGHGSQDIWVSTRSTVEDPWSVPANLGSTINSAASESRPSLSWDADTLLFGRAPGPEGSSDIFVTTREGAASAG
jgi:hypothetical protein